MDSSKSRFLLLGLAVACLGIVLGTALWLRVGPRGPFGRVAPESPGTLTQYGTVPDFSFTERSGSAVSLADLRGKIWIADFIYTNCTDTCPLQTAMMAKLQEQFTTNPAIQLVSFTVDPERDTTQALARYADKYRADAKRWYFLTGSRERMIRLVQDGFHLAVASIANTSDPTEMIPHSPRFVLVDKEAHIRGYYDSRESTALDRLKNDIQSLMKG
jgi:protein SCO1